MHITFYKFNQFMIYQPNCLLYYNKYNKRNQIYEEGDKQIV